MKTLILILIMMQVISQSVQACDGSEAEVQKLIEIAKEAELVAATNSNFDDIVASNLSQDEQKMINGSMIKPLEHNDLKYSEDYYTVGNVNVAKTIGNSKKIWSGTGFKIGRSCIITSAHMLYNEDQTEISKRNSNGTYNYQPEITFTRGFGKNLGNIPANVKAKAFFQMDRVNEDFVRINNTPKFHGHSDLVILKLENDNGSTYSDDHAKSAIVKNPSDFNLTNANLRYGKQIRCVGLPDYKVSKSIGQSCKGNQFLWHQEHARVFDDVDNKTNYRLGLASNVASGPGMSGGPCELNDEKGVFAVDSGANRGSDVKNPIMPDIVHDGNYKQSNARYLSLLHKLDERMKLPVEKGGLGYGLDKINEICK